MSQADDSETITDLLDELRGGGSLGLVRRLRESLWREPGHPLALAALADELCRLGEVETALQVLERAHYLEPDNVDILCRYGQALAQVGREREARLRFEAALRLHPRHRATLDHLKALELPREELPPQPAPRSRSATRESAVATQPLMLPREPIGGIPARLAPPMYVPDNPVEVEHPQGVAGVLREIFNTWGAQPLLWIVAPIGVNVIAYLLAGVRPDLSPYLAGPFWSCGLALLMAPMLLAVANQVRHGVPFSSECRPTPARLLRGASLALPYGIVLIGGCSAILTGGTSLSAETTVLGAMLLTAPFHALAAPALVLAATDGPGGMEALRTLPSLVTRRAWHQLAALLAIGLCSFVILGLSGLLFSREIEAAGELGLAVRIGALSLAHSLWLVALGVCGADSIDFQDDYLSAHGRFAGGDLPPVADKAGGR